MGIVHVPVSLGSNEKDKEEKTGEKIVEIKQYCGRKVLGGGGPFLHV